MSQALCTTFRRMTTFSSVSSVLLAAILACIFAGVCAYDYGDYLIPDTDGYYPLDKRSYNSYCQRCMASDNDWVSCYKCWDRPGRSAPYYGGKKKRGYSNRPGHIVPYYGGKRADETMDFFPEEDIQEEKRGSLFKCTCCMRTGNPGCCSQCNRFFDKRDEKREYVTSFADYGDEEEGCGCCQRGDFSLSCCFRCLQRKK